MKKRFIMMILAALPLIGLMPLNAFAGTDMYILRQPQNPVYNIGAVAGYSVTVAGENLTCTWYLAAASFVVRSLTKKDEPSQQYSPNQNSTTNKNQTNPSKQN